MRIKSYLEFVNEAETSPHSEKEIADLAKDPRILSLVSKAVKKDVSEVKKKIDSSTTVTEEEDLNESLAITFALALPMILEAGGSLINLIKRNFGLDKKKMEEYKKWDLEYEQLKKEIGEHKKSLNSLSNPSEKTKHEEMMERLKKMKEERDEKFGTKIGEKLTHAGHSLHRVYTGPIRALLWGISKFTPPDSKLRKKEIRDKIANIVYAVLMVGYAGYGVWHSISHLSGVSEAATAILDGTKGGKSVSEILSEIPSLLNAFTV